MDPHLYSQLRMAVMSLLSVCFTYFKDKTQATAGNFSVQINKLKEAGYITVRKTFKDNYPLTVCKITHIGVQAFEQYVHPLQSYLHQDK